MDREVDDPKDAAVPQRPTRRIRWRRQETQGRPCQAADFELIVSDNTKFLEYLLISPPKNHQVNDAIGFRISIKPTS
jgi:hypothetical protein